MLSLKHLTLGLTKHAKLLFTAPVLQAAEKTQEAHLPTRPKKPLTPWLDFVRERKESVLSQKRGMNAAELASILAKEWRTVDKSRYEQEYQSKREQYLRQLEEYQNSLSEDQLESIKRKRAMTKEAKAIKELKKTGPPTLPRNAANLYSIERFKDSDIMEQKKYRKMAEIFSDLSKEYNTLSDEQKQKYINMRNEDRIRFQHDFLQWYEKTRNRDDLPKAVLVQVDKMRERFRALNYV